MKRKSAKIVYSLNNKMGSVGKWGNKKAKAIIPVAVPASRNLIYSSSGSFLATFTYSII
jgi:hypothetical protein